MKRLAYRSAKELKDDAGFMRSFSIEEDGCWLWTGALMNNGYARIKRFGKTLSAHRYAYELQFGKIAAEMQLDHRCRNRRCVNPAHLEVVTAKENQRRIPNGNASRTHCVRGHALSGANLFIRRDGRRRCRICHRAQVMRNRATERGRQSHVEAQRKYMRRKREERQHHS
jgi:hypothetical protein